MSDENENKPKDVQLQIVNKGESDVAARTCLAVLNYENGATPNSVRKDIPLLEELMQGLLTGRFVIAIPETGEK